jgi:hypothetical protein
MENTGVEVSADYRGSFGNGSWHYSAGLRLSTYKNRIVEIAPGIEYFDGNSGTGSNRLPSFTRNEVGHPLSAFFGYKVAGLWQSQAEIDDADQGAQKTTGDPSATFESGGEQPGEFRYADINKDGIIDDNDRTYIGNPNPDFTYGLTGSLGYKNLDLRLEFYGVHGNDIFNYTKWFTDFYNSFPGDAVSTRILNSWTPQNSKTNIPVFTQRSTVSTNQVANSYYVEKGSYLRCRNIQLGYTFAKGSLSKVGIENLRVYLQVLNPFTITKYDGLDPALPSDNDGSVDAGKFGADFGNYPFVKQLIFGLNLSF